METSTPPLHLSPTSHEGQTKGSTKHLLYTGISKLQGTLQKTSKIHEEHLEVYKNFKGKTIFLLSIVQHTTASYHHHFYNFTTS